MLFKTCIIVQARIPFSTYNMPKKGTHAETTLENIYIYIYIHTHTYIYIYIYICLRGWERGHHVQEVEVLEGHGHVHLVDLERGHSSPNIANGRQPWLFCRDLAKGCVRHRPVLTCTPCPQGNIGNPQVTQNQALRCRPPGPQYPQRNGTRKQQKQLMLIKHVKSTLHAYAMTCK